jgi:DNA-binding ferritin-like protein
MTYNFHWNVTGAAMQQPAADVKEVEGVPNANDMVRHLVAAQEATARTARKLYPVVESANDQPTADVLSQRLEVHEKTAWMLRKLTSRMRTIIITKWKMAQNHMPNSRNGPNAR